MIALELTSDADLATFRLICGNTRDAVDSDGASFWRKRYLAVFDRPRALPFTHPSSRNKNVNAWFRIKYQDMRRVLRKGTSFKTGGGSKVEEICLVLLRDLAVGTLSSFPPTRIKSS